MRRRRVVVGLAAEAEAQAERARHGAGPGEAGAGRSGGDRVQAASLETRRNGDPAPRAGSGVVRQGICPCGLPASSRCTGGCDRPACGEHLLNRASRLSAPGPYRSEREHTAYLRAFWASAAPLCTWCREAAGAAALDALPPVAPLPGGVLERLTVLLRHPHDYPGDAWEQTVRQHGGPAAVVRLAAPCLLQRRPAKEFEGRNKGDFLTGVSVGGAGAQTTYELLDAGGAVWTVRPLGAGVRRKRRAWVWDRASEERVGQLLPRILELAALR